METKKIKVTKFVDGITTNELNDLFKALDDCRYILRELKQDCTCYHNMYLYDTMLEELQHCFHFFEELQLFQIKEYIVK